MPSVQVVAYNECRLHAEVERSWDADAIKRRDAYINRAIPLISEDEFPRYLIYKKLFRASMRLRY